MEHKKQFCQSKEKVPWTNYVKDFKSINKLIPAEFFGKWIDIVKKVSSEQMGRPKPHTREQYINKLDEAQQLFNDHQLPSQSRED